MTQVNDQETHVNAGVMGERGQVEVLYVYDKVLKKNFVRVRFRSKSDHLCHIISMGDISADQTTKELELNVARMGGALCERHCEKYSETIDPMEAAAAAVEGLRRLKAMVRNEQSKTVKH